MLPLIGSESSSVNAANHRAAVELAIVSIPIRPRARTRLQGRGRGCRVNLTLHVHVRQSLEIPIAKDHVPRNFFRYVPVNVITPSSSNERYKDEELQLFACLVH